MNCPECSRRLTSGATSCKCGWVADEASRDGKKPIRWDDCFGCGAHLPWPSHKQEKAQKRIIGMTKNRQPICQDCFEKSPEWDWRSEAMKNFAEKHRENNWGVLMRMAHALKGAPKDDKVEFMGYLKDEARKHGGLTKKLPYDPTKREPA